MMTQGNPMAPPSEQITAMSIVSRLVAQACWRIELSYADELILHFGVPVPFVLPKGVGNRVEGQWILCSRGTPWKIASPSRDIISSSEPTERIEQVISGLSGTVTSVLVTENLGLLLQLSHDLILIITPSAKDDDEDVAYWELFTPDKKVLVVGPKKQVSYVSSDAPMAT